MARFLYQAKSTAGKIVTGDVEAGNENEARNKIRSQQLIPLKVVASNGALKSAPAKPGQVGFFEGLFAAKPSGKDMKIFTRQMSTLLNAGIPVVDALQILGNGLRAGVLKDAILGTKTSIESGRRLADSMSRYPLVFDRFYVNMVRAGEEAGILDSILMRLALYMEKAESLKGQIKGAMMYPAAIIVIAIIVITGILVFIIPQFTALYASAGQAPPALTLAVVNLSKFVSTRWYLVLGFFIGAPLAFRFYYDSPQGKEVCDRLFLRAPLFGSLIQKSSMAKMTRTLSTLLSSGVGVIEALDIAAKTSGNYVVEKALMDSKDAVTGGKPLAHPLSKEKVFPDMVVQMITIGEQSGTLDGMLGKIADFYEEEVDVAVSSMTKLIEPILMVVLGGIIAILVIAMYLPVFDMANVASGGAK